jgi:hypothetical protein
MLAKRNLRLYIFNSFLGQMMPFAMPSLFEHGADGIWLIA